MKPPSILPSTKTSACLAAVFSVLLVIGAVSPSQADDMYVWAEEIGGDVIFYFDGSVDLTDFPAITPGNALSMISPATGLYLSTEVAGSPVDAYFSTMAGIAAQAFGTGGNTQPTSYTGDHFGFSETIMFHPVGYAGGTRISGSMTFSGTTFTALGVDPTPKSFDTAVGANTVFLFTPPPYRP